jgi:mono/diheme cytochrome c family protein
MHRLSNITLFIAFLVLTASNAWPQGLPKPSKEEIRRGFALFHSYGCAQCHQKVGNGRGNGPDLSRVARWSSPLIGAAVMWNHISLMDKAMKEQKLSWPQFKGGDIRAIFAYLHSINREKIKITPYQGGKSMGRRAYAEAGCQTCHGRPNNGGRIGPDLGKIAWRTKDEEEFANRMLSHGPPMLDIAKKAGLIWPTLTGHKIVNIFTYLQALDTSNRR